MGKGAAAGLGKGAAAGLEMEAAVGLGMVAEGREKGALEAAVSVEREGEAGKAVEREGEAGKAVEREGEAGKAAAEHMSKRRRIGPSSTKAEMRRQRSCRSRKE